MKRVHPDMVRGVNEPQNTQQASPVLRKLSGNQQQAQAQAVDGMSAIEVQRRFIEVRGLFEICLNHPPEKKVIRAAKN